jgi:hypothetical protein
MPINRQYIKRCFYKMISGLSIRELKELSDGARGLSGMACKASLMEHIVVITRPFMVSNIKKFQGA